MKIGCLIAQISLPENIHSDMDNISQTRYDSLAECAVASFQKFHPDVELHYVNDFNFIQYYNDHFKTYDLINHVGIVRYMLAYEIMRHFNYDKIIILGCDTITCDKMDEFIDNNQDDILATLNYPCQESTEYWTTPVFEFNIDDKKFIDFGNINADVVCFNSKDALARIIELSIEHFTHFGEQGALNEMAWVEKSHSVKIIDFPYPISNVVYNARSKGVFGTNMIVKGKLAKHGPSLDGQFAPTTKFYVKDKKLYTQDHKQIKCFHYVEGLGGRSNEEFNEIINDFKANWFNKETVNFFKEECGCLNFFN
jgi:hypothetical protein